VGLARALLALLAARGVALQDTERAQILDERDAARLERWVARAVTCRTADELFMEPGESG
jgi:hypothetical protein